MNQGNKEERVHLLSQEAFRLRGKYENDNRRREFLYMDLLRERFAGRTEVSAEDLQNYVDEMDKVVPANCGKTAQFTAGAKKVLDSMRNLADLVYNSFTLLDWDVTAEQVIRREVEVLLLVSQMAGTVREIDGDGEIVTCDASGCGCQFVPTLVRIPVTDRKTGKPKYIQLGHYFAYRGKVFGPVCDRDRAYDQAETERGGRKRNYYSKAEAERVAQLQTKKHQANVRDSKEKAKYFPSTDPGRQSEAYQNRRGPRF